jgi:hypothetical protein
MMRDVVMGVVFGIVGVVGIVFGVIALREGVRDANDNYFWISVGED